MRRLRTTASAKRRTSARMATGAALAAGALFLSACSGAAGSGDGSVEIVFYNQSRGQEATLTKLATQYSAENNVTVTVETPGPADFPAKLQTLAQSNSMPDIYSALDPDGMAPYYRAGWAMDLSGELEGEWGESFHPLALELNAFSEGNNLDVEPGVYSVHWDYNMFGLFADPAKAGIAPAAAPATVREFTDALRASGGLFSVAASLTPNLVQSCASNFMTDEEISATLAGKAPWETDQWRKTFQVFVDLRDAGVIASNSLPGGSDDNPNVENSFFSVRDVSVIFDQAAAVGVGRATAPDFTDYVSLPVPAAEDGTQDPRPVVRLGKGAAVNPKGDHPEQALAFVKWLTEPEQQEVFAAEVPLIPTSAEVLAAGGFPAQLAGVASAVTDAQAVPTSFTTDVRTAIGRAAQSIVLGEKTIDEALADVQAAQDLTA
jgi:raffinose/stachyose/melibiose transport system substrate-binding protein